MDVDDIYFGESDEDDDDDDDEESEQAAAAGAGANAIAATGRNAASGGEAEGVADKEEEDEANLPWSHVSLQKRVCNYFNKKKCLFFFFHFSSFHLNLLNTVCFCCYFSIFFFANSVVSSYSSVDGLQVH